jgi:hypothetical protein
MSEIHTVPAFVVADDNHIIEVGFTRAYVHRNIMRFIETIEIPIPEKAQAKRVVFETPHGCFEYDLGSIHVRPGDTLSLTFRPGDGTDIVRCRSPRFYVDQPEKVRQGWSRQ